MSEERDKKLYAEDGRAIVDVLFDKNLLDPRLTRGDLRDLENYVSYLIEARVTSHIRGKELLEQLKRSRVI